MYIFVHCKSYDDVYGSFVYFMMFLATFAHVASYNKRYGREFMCGSDESLEM